jgi:hypothetical protein
LKRVIGEQNRYKPHSENRPDPDGRRKFEAKKEAVHQFLKNGGVTTGLPLEER